MYHLVTEPSEERKKPEGKVTLQVRPGHIFNPTDIIKGQYGPVVICRGPQRNMGNLFANYKCMQLQVQERVQRIVMWINQNFLLSEELETKTDLDVEFLVLRDNSSLTFSMDGKGVLNITTNYQHQHWHRHDFKHHRC